MAGAGRFQRIRLVTLPLMFRIVLPSLSNTFISLFKDTSIASAIAVPELTFVALKVNQDTFRIIEVWVIAGSIYLAVCWLIALGLRRLERRFRVALGSDEPHRQVVARVDRVAVDNCAPCGAGPAHRHACGDRGWAAAAPRTSSVARPDPAVRRPHTGRSDPGPAVCLVLRLERRRFRTRSPGRRRGCTQRVRGRTRDRDRPRWDRVPVPPHRRGGPVDRSHRRPAVPPGDAAGAAARRAALGQHRDRGCQGDLSRIPDRRPGT